MAKAPKEPQTVEEKLVDAEERLTTVNANLKEATNDVDVLLSKLEALIKDFA